MTVTVTGENDIESPESYVFLDALQTNSEKRRKALLKNGSTIFSSVKSNQAYLRTIFLLRERAIRNMIVPLTIVTLNAIIWIILIKHPFKGQIIIQNDPWGSVSNLVFTTTLAFLLVFRLNRVAIRWWDTRTMWGIIIASSRILTDAILEHLSHEPLHRDNAISWLGGFVVSVKQHMRKDLTYDYNELAGFLTKEEIDRMSTSNHPCLFATTEIRYHLKQGLKVTKDTPVGLAVAYSSELRMMEKSIHILIDKMGGLERVSSTPLPIVFLTHLRTFLMIYLLSLPYLNGHEWGWTTIPIVFITSYALLGVDSAASECEAPFKKRANHLAMESYCLTGLDNIQELVRHHSTLKRHYDDEDSTMNRSSVTQNSQNTSDMRTGVEV